MPVRLPDVSDFAEPMRPLVTIIPPQQPNHQPTNILLLLHGLGDSAGPFASLARSLALPHTACVALRGPAALPFDLGGFHWGDDIQFDPSRPDGAMDMDTGFAKAVRLIAQDVIASVLLGKCGYTTRNILLFGFGQGGMAALAAAASPPLSEGMGGVVSIGGPLPESSLQLLKGNGDGTRKVKTPVLACHGSTRSAITNSKAKEVKDVFEDVHIVEWKRPGDGMMQNREEMLPIMRFFARTLRTTAPKGTFEVT